MAMSLEGDAMTATARDNETALALQRMVAGNVYSSAQADAIAAALSAARQEQRELDAKVCDCLATRYGDGRVDEWGDGYNDGCIDCSRSIRAERTEP
jgi:hypothetical protein